MASPSNEELLAEIRALGAQLHSLREEVERLKPGLHSAPQPPKPVPVPPKPKSDPLGAAPKGPVRKPFAFDEKFVGEKLLQYAGMVILALGIIFFLIWTAAHAGPELRVLIAAAAGAACILGGREAQKRPPYDKLSGTLIGGGWTVLYMTAYAAYHFPATKIIASIGVDVGLLLAVAGGMILHAVSRRSRPLRLYAMGLTYFVMLLCRQELGNFDLFLILLGASAAIAVAIGEADVLLAALAGYYANYLPVYFKTILMAPAQRTLDNFLWPFGWLAGGYLMIAALPFIPKARARLFSASQSRLAEAALCANCAAFALLAGSMGRVYFGVPSLPRAAALSLFFALPSLAYTKLLSRRSNAAGLNGILALGLLAAAIFSMPDPMWKLLAWILVSAAWVWVGLFVGHPMWRAAGLAMSVLTFFFYADVARRGIEDRRAASMALFLFTGISYFFSRFHRLWLDDPEEWEKPSAEFWLHAGSLALMLALWGVLDAAPFLCVLAALAIVAEQAAVRMKRAALWVQASILELGLCAYSFIVDYGANLPMAGVSPRLLTTGVAVAGCAYLYFADPMEEELAARWTGWSKAGQRRALSWLMNAAAAFAVYHEFDGRLRLPVWALWSLGLYRLGQTRKNTDFKRQAVALAGGAAVEAGLTYLMAPPQLLSPLSAYQAIFFWGACAALLGGLVLAKERRWGPPSPLDARAAGVFGWLPLLLGACYLAKELDRVQLTLAWTGLGLVFLVGGILLGWHELRHPALGLLGLCVAKALFFDTANLPLPQRVASFVALGVVLLFASGLYVRSGSRDEQRPPPDPG